MDHFFAISILFFPIATVLGSQFWKDVDSLHNDLAGPQDLPTQINANEEAQQVESTPPAPRHSASPNEVDEKQLKYRRQLIKKYHQKNVTLSVEEVETFKLTIIIDKSYPENISIEEIKNKLLALKRLEEWFDLDTYDIDKYPNYWAKVCLSFWNKPVAKYHKYFCSISPSYGINKMKSLTIGGRKQYFDLLYCKCYHYKSYYRTPISAPAIFLIHKSGENEFYIFGQNSKNLTIKDFKGGITLPQPLDEKHGDTLELQSTEKKVTLIAEDLEIFNQSITIDKSYPENVSLVELEDKLIRFEEIHFWPELRKYSFDIYSMYWANLCVFLWGKQLDITHRQACILNISYGSPKIRKLLIRGRILYYDLLSCKCHSYISNSKKPISNPDTFLIHQASDNEFFVFEQRVTTLTQYTLFIKGYKRMINQPDPEAFK